MKTDQHKSPEKEKKGGRSIYRWIKSIALTVLIFVVILVSALFALPYFFKDQVLQAVKETANEQMRAELDFRDANLTFFRDFPRLTLSLEDYSVTNQEPFAGMRLIEGKRFSLSFDLFSVIDSDRPLLLNAVELDEPRVHVLVLADGQANYDISLPADSSSVADTTMAGPGFEIDLENYTITNGHLIYDDRSLDVFVESVALNHSGSGRFTLDLYDLDTDTQMDALTLDYGGIRYLNQTRVDLEAGILINLLDQQYTLKENRLLLNELAIEAAGYVDLSQSDRIEMDLSFSAPGNDFREFLSLIPNAFTAGYEDVEAGGNFSLSGKVSGSLSETEYPAIDLQLSINNGHFRYPDLPLGISAIQTQATVTKPRGDLDLLRVQIPDFQLRIGEELVSGHFNLARPVSDPDIDAGLRGQINLRDVVDAYPISGVEKLTGVLTADVTARARMSQLMAEAYEETSVSGTLDLRDLEYVATGSPAIRVSEAGLNFTPEKIDIRQFSAQLGASDFSLGGEVRNFLAYFSPSEVMTGTLTFQSGLLDLNEWMGESTGETDQVYVSASPGTDAATTELFHSFDFIVDAQIERLLYDTYDLQDLFARGRVSANRTNVEEFRMRMDQSDLYGTGYITNTWDYVFNGGTLGGRLQLQSNNFDLNPFMVSTEAEATSTGTAESDYGIILVPDNIDMQITGNFGRLQYTDLELIDLSGRLIIADETVAIEDCTTKLLGGQLALTGSYDTQDRENPYFNLKYDVQEFSFQRTFQAFNTFQALAPIGKYINGTFNSTLIMEGNLGPDMSPDLNTVYADGFLETFNAVVQGFPPLQAVGNKLNVDYFNNLPIQDTRNWFEFVNGAVVVKPFDLTYQDIDMEIGGSHSLSQEIDYQILALVPRDKLTGNAVGAAADSGLDFLRSQASSLGINLEESEFVNLQIDLTGSLTAPKVGVKLLGTEGQASLVEAATDEARAQLEAEKERLEDEARDRLEAEKEKLETQAQNLKDTVVTKATEKVDEAKKEAQDAAQKEAEKAKEKLKEEAQKSVDDIRNELENFNPFKKKKKEGGG